MAGFIWNTNHRMWRVVPPFTDSYEVLRAYVCDPCAYVYWSTPRLHDEIGVGDVAFILRTADENRNSGIIARGRVEETPRQLTLNGANLFASPERLTPAGWDENIAPSAWKTGIRIERTFWDAPVSEGFRPAVGTVGRLSEEDIVAIEKEIAGR